MRKNHILFVAILQSLHTSSQNIITRSVILVVCRILPSWHLLILNECHPRYLKSPEGQSPYEYRSHSYSLRGRKLFPLWKVPTSTFFHITSIRLSDPPPPWLVGLNIFSDRSNKKKTYARDSPLQSTIDTWVENNLGWYATLWVLVNGVGFKVNMFNLSNIMWHTSMVVDEPVCIDKFYIWCTNRFKEL